jgi:hypothetical protein
MTDTQDPEQEGVTPDIGATEQLRLLVADLRSAADAEMHYWRTRLVYSQSVGTRVLLLGLAAIIAIVAASIALVVGLILTLEPLIGPGLATLAVTILFILIAAICALQARNWARKLQFPEIDRDE